MPIHATLSPENAEVTAKQRCTVAISGNNSDVCAFNPLPVRALKHWTLGTLGKICTECTYCLLFTSFTLVLWSPEALLQSVSIHSGRAVDDDLQLCSYSQL